MRGCCPSPCVVSFISCIVEASMGRHGHNTEIARTVMFRIARFLMECPHPHLREREETNGDVFTSHA